MGIYLSQIVGKAVWDLQGQKIGRCADILVREREHGPAQVRAVAIERGNEPELLVPAEHVASLTPGVVLKSATPPPYVPQGDEVRLRSQVLDRQIVDVEGRRLVRANDLQLVRHGAEGRYFVSGVAAGVSSFLRRLGFEGAYADVLKRIGRQPLAEVIPWQDVAPVEADAPIRLRVAKNKISQINPVDIADIISELDRQSGMALLRSLDNETAADAIQEIEPELQVSMLTTLPPERAADVLEEMDPDSAADVLASLEDAHRDNLLALMEEEESTDVQKLLAYPEDTAGGIMTTEYTTIPTGLTVGQALDYLRQSASAREDETMYYVHIADENGRLRGVLTLRDLVMADPSSPVDEIMERHPITVNPTVSQREVARIVAKYNLLEVPVVDEQGVLHGIVTVDDAIDAVIPTAWKKRLPHFY